MLKLFLLKFIHTGMEKLEFTFILEKLVKYNLKGFLRAS